MVDYLFTSGNFIALLTRQHDSKTCVSPLPYSHLMTTKGRRRSIKLLTCPGCSAVGTLRKIVYGMPDPDTFDFEKYAVGGCCMNGDGSDPDIACRQCEWEGLRDQQFGQ
jgi:hypothetical protein